ncbi:hypothetical protein ACEWY4_025855 [Coilia grayii]|uniref:LITAF domain-containing protein n=1 Tax=Coilia grayii TaxID=363190 RepID=A0ABD1IT45_9TELE
MSDTGGESELDPASKALWLIAFRRQHLQHRNNLLVKARDISLRAQPSDTAPPQDNINVEELEAIQAELEELSKREDMLRRSGSLQKDPQDVIPQDKLRRDSDWVKCDSCSLVVQTVVRHRVTNTTWFMCGIFSAVGCLFGCCLLPFLLNYFKDVSHYCPNCKAKIRNVPRF